MRTYEDYKRIGNTFPSRFDGKCAIDPRHKVRKKDQVSFIQLKENPFIIVEGVACRSCVLALDE